MTSLLPLTGELTTEIAMLSEMLADLLARHQGYRVAQRLPGIGPVLAAVIVAEIGTSPRFPDARAAGEPLTQGHATLENQPVAPRTCTARVWISTCQRSTHRDLVPEHQDLRSFGGITARQEHQPAEHP